MRVLDLTYLETCIYDSEQTHSSPVTSHKKGRVIEETDRPSIQGRASTSPSTESMA